MEENSCNFFISSCKRYFNLKAVSLCQYKVRFWYNEGQNILESIIYIR